MKFTLNWLKDHLQTTASLDDITDKLTAIGLELEGVENIGEKLGNFIIGKIVKAKQHPNADRLKVCHVDIGENDTIQVVCGAPNASEGLVGVFAPVGIVIPGSDLLLKAGDIRGVASNGMLCSERELMISDEHDGIISLDGGAPIGEQYAKWAGLDDAIIEINVTPNRGDCLGVRGIARDLAAAGMGKLKPLHYQAIIGDFASDIRWNIDDTAVATCPYVCGRYFANVKNGPSPQWMQRRLKAIGLRPISALVDITNYVTFDLGRPLHVFDADKLAENTLTIRMAKKGEVIDALDEKSYQLSENMTVISDEVAIQGLAGIMGAATSGCDENTKNVFLEVALFDKVNVAETGRDLGIISDARYRFERGIDPSSAEWGVHIASEMILELCGGTPGKISKSGTIPHTTHDITLPINDIQKHGGVDIPVNEAAKILKALGFDVNVSDKSIQAIAPTWRGDIEGKHCLIEEILRIYGFDKVPQISLMRDEALSPAISPMQRRASFARRALANIGMMEAVTWSFTTDELAHKFFTPTDDTSKLIELKNPISTELTTMRPSLLPNLLLAAMRNIDRGHGDVALFEVGSIFKGDSYQQQHIQGAGVRTGDIIPLNCHENKRKSDVFDAKADALEVLRICGAPVQNLQTSGENLPQYYHPYRSGALRLGPNILAHFGELHPRIALDIGLEQGASMFEIYLENIPANKKKTAARPLLKSSNLQAVTRDFAFLLRKDIASEKLCRAVIGADKNLITDAYIFDIYQHADLGENVSLSVRVTLQPFIQTLTDKDIKAVSDKIIAAAEKLTGAKLRQ